MSRRLAMPSESPSHGFITRSTTSGVCAFADSGWVRGDESAGNPVPAHMIHAGSEVVLIVRILKRACDTASTRWFRNSVSWCFLIMPLALFWLNPVGQRQRHMNGALRLGLFHGQSAA